MVKISELLKKSCEILENAGIDSAKFDSKCILEDVLHMDSFSITANGFKEVSVQDCHKVMSMTKKRSEGFPLQYILGEWEFYGLPFKVGEGVLIPRPDTETLVDVVLNYCKGKSNLKIIDLCSGSGCIAVSLEKNTVGSEVYAVELSDIAFEYLKSNIALNNSSVKAVKANVLSEDTAKLFSNADVIVSNPPYLTGMDMKQLQKEVSFEPEMALYGCDDGLEFYRKIPEIWGKVLKKDGLVAFEIGMGQEDDVSSFLSRNNIYNISTANDLAGIKRVVYGLK